MIEINKTFIERLRYVYRFSQVRRLHDESVAEHSYYTTIYAWMFLQIWKQDNPLSVVNNVEHITLLKGLFHDIAEGLTGDYIRSFKYHNAELKKMIDREEILYLESELRDKEIPGAMEILNYNSCAKEPHNTSGQMIIFADLYSVYNYIVQEIENGNQDIRNALVDMREYAHSIKDLKIFRESEKLKKTYEDMLKHLKKLEVI